jgi:DMSO reductase anchor subunit
MSKQIYSFFILISHAAENTLHYFFIFFLAKGGHFRAILLMANRGERRRTVADGGERGRMEFFGLCGEP